MNAKRDYFNTMLIIIFQYCILFFSISTIKSENKNLISLPADEYFQVLVNGSNPYVENAAQNSSVKKDSILYYNNSHFKMPATAVDRPLKLVVFCLGGSDRTIGVNYDNAYRYMNMGAVFNDLGYAYLTIAGLPAAFCSDKGISDAGAYCMNWMCIEAFKKSYEYIINKYNIDRNGVFIYGQSQGGSAAENIAELSGIPVCATILDAPSISAQWTQVFKVNKRNSTVQKVLGALYNITDMDTYQVNKANIGILDPFSRGMDIYIDKFKTETEISSGTATAFQNGYSIDSIKAKKQRMTRSPLLLMVGLSDNVISADVMMAYGKACQNGGSDVQMKLYDKNLLVGNSYNSAGKHGVVQFTANYTSLNGNIITKGFYDLLEFMYKYGGINLDKAILSTETVICSPTKSIEIIIKSENIEISGFASGSKVKISIFDCLGRIIYQTIQIASDQVGIIIRTPIIYRGIYMINAKSEINNKTISFIF